LDIYVIALVKERKRKRFVIVLMNERKNVKMNL